MRRWLVVLAALTLASAAVVFIPSEAVAGPRVSRLDRLVRRLGEAIAALLPSVPGQPGAATVDGGTLSASVTWGAADAGTTNPVLSYLVYLDGGVVADGGDVLSLTAWGLNCGQGYALDVVPQNSVGTGPLRTSNTGYTAACPPDAGSVAVIDMQAFVDGGVGLPTISGDFCSLLLAGQDAGGWACYREDGGFTGAGFTKSSGTYSADNVCPNGGTCLPTSGFFGENIAAISSSVDRTPTAYTVCAKTLRNGTSGHALSVYGAKITSCSQTGTECDDNSCNAANNCCNSSIPGCDPVDTESIFLGENGSPSTGSSLLVFRVNNQSPGATYSQPWVIGYSQLICGVYKNGAQTVLFVDGVAVADGGTPSGSALASQEDTNSFGSSGGLFVTGVDLSASQILAIAHATNADSIKTAGGADISFSRSSEASCTMPDGRIGWLPTGRPCVTQPSGFGTGGALALRPASTNYAIKNYAQNPTGGYTKTGTITTSTAQASPDSVSTAWTFAGSTSGAKWATTTGIAITASNLVVSAWVKHASSTQTVDLRLVDSTGAATKCTANATATTSWQQIQCTASVTSGNSFKLEMYPGGVSGTGTTTWWCPMIESGTVASDSCIRAGAAAATRAAETATLATPSMTSGQTFCMAARGKSSDAWSASTAPSFIAFGSGANSSGLALDSSGKPVFQVTDNNNHSLTFTATNATASGDEIAGCTTGGVLTAFVDGGTELAGSVSGTGDGGVTSPGATTTLGNTSGTYKNLYIGQLCIGNKKGCLRL